jgi:transposase
MARYKEYDYSQGKFIPIQFDRQILPGTFEYTLHYLVDNEIDLSIFDSRYRNDETGAPAYDPAILLKIILYAYSRGITSSRKIAQCCRENTIFMALSADTQPHFMTIAEFISSSDLPQWWQCRGPGPAGNQVSWEKDRLPGLRSTGELPDTCRQH